MIPAATPNLALGSALLAGLCAFLTGSALNQGTTCAVTAARQWIDKRQARMLIGFGVAVAAAGLVWLPLAWFADGMVHLPPGRPLGWGLVLGAGLLGVGAVLNRACLLGSISRIGDGKLRFLGLPVGLAIGFALADRASLTTPAALPNPLAHPSPVGIAVLGVFAVMLIAGWVWMQRTGDRGNFTRWPWRVSMVALGVSGALLFALAPGWTIADAVRQGVAPLHPVQLMSASGMSTSMMNATLGLTMFALLCAGAIASSIRRRTFRYKRPSLIALSRSIGGGAVMAFGASLVPGGNDTLLLSDLPAATLSGLVAYVAMSAVVFALLLIRKAMTPRPAPIEPSAPAPSRAPRAPG